MDDFEMQKKWTRELKRQQDELLEEKYSSEEGIENMLAIDKDLETLDGAVSRLNQHGRNALTLGVRG